MQLQVDPRSSSSSVNTDFDKIIVRQTVASFEYQPNTFPYSIVQPNTRIDAKIPLSS